MPIEPPEDQPAGTIRRLGLPARAVTALTRSGITRAEDLALLTRRDLAAVDGLGPGLLAAIRLVVPEPPPSATRSEGAAEQESPAAPPMPSFESLRAPKGRTAVDVLMPPAPSATRRPPAGAPRPPEYADLVRLGVHVARAVADVPRRATLWSIREPIRLLRRLVGDPVCSSARARANTRPRTC